MKQVSLILIVSILIAVTLTSVSLADEMKIKSVDTILSEIRTEQGISSSEKINPDKVSQAKLEELGDSVMEAMIGNTAMHDQMDIRLGGDGSDSLKAFHINVGLNYLTDYPNGMMNLMSGGMMSNNNSYATSGWNGYSMMNSYASVGVFVGFFLLLLIVVIALIVLAILKSKKPTVANEKSLEILGRRYANGEITKEEFDVMTKNIRSLK